MLLFVLGFSLSLVDGKSLPENHEQCLATGSKFYNFLSTKTPYDVVRGDIPKLKDCKAEAMWAFIRHGTRFGYVHEMKKYSNLTAIRDQILQNHAEGRGSLCSEDLEGLAKWELVADPNQAMLLTTSGFEELRRLGHRLGKRFEDLLEDSPDVNIRITSKERTRQSAEAFVTGLYEAPMKFDSSFVYDALLKNEQNCPSWKDKGSEAKKEIAKMKNSTEIQDVISSVSRRLGFERDLDLDVISNMYHTCSYEYSSYHSASTAHWCSVFSELDLQVMEFLEDLIYYYRSGYGNYKTKHLGCFLVDDMMNRLSEDPPKSTLYFAHSTGLRKLLTSLGIGDGEAIKGDGFSTAKDRHWRTSFLTPFAGNVIAVRYRCKGAEGRRVAVFVNERLHKLAACNGLETCSLDELRQHYASLTDPAFCNRDFCTLPGTDEEVKDVTDD